MASIVLPLTPQDHEKIMADVAMHLAKHRWFTDKNFYHLGPSTAPRMRPKSA